jgi:hypoxanthine phosphoribosyltransferase
MQPKNEPRREMISWDEVDRLIDHLIPQFEREFTAMVIITRGGIVPGGLLSEAMDVTHVLTAAVDFPAQAESEAAKLMAWPAFIQFPADDKLRGRPTIIVDDVWGSGRTITAVKNRVSAAGGFPETCVLHFNPYRNLFGHVRPDYFAATTDAFIVYPWESLQRLDSSSGSTSARTSSASCDSAKARARLAPSTTRTRA